jgi:peptidoglycan L-alanyl-D-glutamate endopeptidase CwlK
MINSRSIHELTAEARTRCGLFLKICKLLGYNTFLTSTYRDKEFQDQLYEQGRTTPGKIVTNARGGQSAHQYRIAWDVAFRPEDEPGGCTYEGDWDALGVIAEMMNLDWGGNNLKFKDKPHFQLKRKIQ